MTETPPARGDDDLGGPTPGPPAGGMAPSDERTWAMLAHLGGIVLGFIAPLVVLLVQGEKSQFVRRASIESLNFQITLVIAYVVCGVLVLLLVGLLLLPIVFVVSLVLMIVAGVKANGGEEYRYPVTVRFVQ